MQKTVEKRARIIDAAIEVFGTDGFDAASMADVAAKAEVAKGTLYLYFASKELLFEEAYQLCCREREEACGAQTEVLSGALDRLCLRLRNGTRWEMAAPLKNRLVRAYLTHPRFSRSVRRVVEGLNTGTLEAIVRQGIEGGELRPMPAELLEEMYIRFGSAVYYHLEKHPEEAESEEMWQQIFASLRGCLGAQSKG